MGDYKVILNETLQLLSALSKMLLSCTPNFSSHLIFPQHAKKDIHSLQYFLYVSWVCLSSWLPSDVFMATMCGGQSAQTLDYWLRVWCLFPELPMFTDCFWRRFVRTCVGLHRGGIFCLHLILGFVIINVGQLGEWCVVLWWLNSDASSLFFVLYCFCA